MCVDSKILFISSVRLKDHVLLLLLLVENEMY